MQQNSLCNRPCKFFFKRIPIWFYSYDLWVIEWEFSYGIIITSQFIIIVILRNMSQFIMILQIDPYSDNNYGNNFEDIVQTLPFLLTFFFSIFPLVMILSCSFTSEISCLYIYIYIKDANYLLYSNSHLNSHGPWFFH